MSTRPFPVDAGRLRRDIEENSQFGAVATDEGVARTVLPGTEANRRARQNLVDRLIDADLVVDVDAVGNIVGTWSPDGCDEDAAPVAAGSHLDSVPNGGIFDGPLGVFAALEAVRAMQDAGVSPRRPVEVVSFTGEEGSRFGEGVLGSSVAAGLLDPPDALALSDGSATLQAALEDIGFRGESQLDASRWDAWLELHIEQSGRLERLDVPVGVVTTIAGTSRLAVTIEGDADHSGTAGMTDRTDALAAASEVVLGIETAAREAADATDTAVATVGDLTVDPGVVNVVPGRVECTVDIRDVEATVIERLVERTASLLAEGEANRGVTTTLERPYDIPPTPMTPGCRDACHAAGETVGVETVDLHSGAGHDTMQLAQATDVGLLFAPSAGGHSHSQDEWTPWHRCAAATDVLTAALADLAGVER
jgi:N-carbamoyl-L-amino-acid hydrolase